MRKIVIDMQNYLFADVVAAAFKSSDYDIEVIRAESPRDTVELCQIYEPFVLVMEVPGSPPPPPCPRRRPHRLPRGRPAKDRHRPGRHRRCAPAARSR